MNPPERGDRSYKAQSKTDSETTWWIVTRTT